MTQENTEFYIFTGHGNQEENGTSDFGTSGSLALSLITSKIRVQKLWFLSLLDKLPRMLEWCRHPQSTTKVSVFSS